MSEYMIFCLGEGRWKSKGIGYQKNHHAFNKPVSEERYKEILKYCREVLKDLKLELNKESWTNEWNKVTTDQWNKLAELPEWDKEVVEGIVGFELDLEEELITVKLSKATIDELKKSGIKIV